MALDPATQVLVVGMVVVTAIGAAGVPGGSIPLLVMILDMVGIPPEGIGIVLGVDRLLDMARTVPNPTGDLLVSLAVARAEGVELAGETPAPPVPAYERRGAAEPLAEAARSRAERADPASAG